MNRSLDPCSRHYVPIYLHKVRRIPFTCFATLMESSEEDIDEHAFHID